MLYNLILSYNERMSRFGSRSQQQGDDTHSRSARDENFQSPTQ